MPIFDSRKPHNGEVIVAGPTNDAHWKQTGVTTHGSTTVKGLTSGTKYWLRVRALLGDQQSNRCASALCIGAVTG